MSRDIQDGEENLREMAEDDTKGDPTFNEFEESENGITVRLHVEGIELGEYPTKVIETYTENILTFIQKNKNYGNSFVTGAKIESMLKNGEVVDSDIPDFASRQIFVRGFLDKLSRFYQLQFEDETDEVGEEVDDTLLDLGNYAIMLASILREHEDE